MKCEILALLFVLSCSVNSSEIPTKFLIDLLQKFSKKYVIWYLDEENLTMQMKRDITDFGRQVNLLHIFNQYE